jgi:hypothetical protein
VTDFFMKIAGAIAMAIISRIAQTVRRSMDQFTKSGDRIEPTRVKRVTADETAGGKPASLECAMPRDRFEGVLRARGREPAARRQRRRDGQLIATDERSDESAGHLGKEHGLTRHQERSRAR